MKGLPHYTFSVEDDVICCVDHKTGPSSITKGVELVLVDLADYLGNDLNGKRIIYRDTMDRWDGIAHRGTAFLGFVPLQTRDRQEAILAARQHPGWPV